MATDDPSSSFRVKIKFECTNLMSAIIIYLRYVLPTSEHVDLHGVGRKTKFRMELGLVLALVGRHEYRYFG